MIAEDHAIVWEEVHHMAKRNADRHTDVSPSLMRTLAVFALIVSMAYQKKANGK